MPTYDYACPGCGIEEDRRVPLSQKDIQTCDKCGETLKQVWKRFPGVTRASYIDSNKTARARSMEDVKAASKARASAYNHPPGSDEREGLLKEAKTREKVKP